MARPFQAIASFALRSVGGLSVEVCASGSEAVARAPGFLPEIVLLDAMMPGMDGFSTLRALRSLPQTATTPVVFMTARARPHEIEQYRRGGACDVILKPFDERTDPGASVFAALATANAQGRAVREAQVFAFNLPPIIGLGTGSGFENQITETPMDMKAMMGRGKRGMPQRGEQEQEAR